MLLPTPYPALVLNGITVFPFKSYCVKKLLIGGGNCIPQVGNPRKKINHGTTAGF
jgi:hypothetical protein